jgi:excisionase family DNA binding protein
MTENQTAEQVLGRVVDAMPVQAASPYLTAPEAAAYLRTTVQGIYSLVKRRRVFPMPGRPGRLLFTREALDRYLNTRRRH